ADAGLSARVENGGANHHAPENSGTGSVLSEAAPNGKDLTAERTISPVTSQPNAYCARANPGKEDVMN
ncbi:MAG: hypothetical protein OXF51_00185, partial [Alphaproteobacteria bacterium]|nr:hypothetical protein [Alphaproteobacteria bacterium]